MGHFSEDYETTCDMEYFNWSVYEIQRFIAARFSSYSNPYSIMQLNGSLCHILTVKWDLSDHAEQLKLVYPNKEGKSSIQAQHFSW